MQIRHQLCFIAMGGDQIFVHVARMGCGKAQALYAANQGQMPYKLAKAPRRAVIGNAVIGIHILPQKGNFFHAFGRKRAHLRYDLRYRAGHFCAARIRHNTEGTKLITAFLDGYKCSKAFDVAVDGQFVKFFQRVEISF